ncbi:MAG: NAD(+)/NADH kinase [Clostridia bacterium]|nr:NAD(+)/NADH kinase [Clostridia bacterium]
MEKAYIYPNFSKPIVYDTLSELLQHLENAGIKALMSASAQKRVTMRLGEEQAARIEFMPEPEACRCCDLIIAVGGDGTILSAAENASKYDKPILGVNIGRLGFMSTLESNELALISKLRGNDFALDRRMMLRVKVVDKKGNVRVESNVLNEVTVSKSVVSKGVGISVDVNGKKTISFIGDGVIICTPTGSTAYSLAAGGPILEPTSDCIAVTPICPHSMHIKSFVAAAHNDICVRADFRTQKLLVSRDGHKPYLLKAGDSVQVEKSTASVSLIQLKEKGFYEIISEKFMGERDKS